jgi:hypothetical protein
LFDKIFVEMNSSLILLENLYLFLHFINKELESKAFILHRYKSTIDKQNNSKNLLNLSLNKILNFRKLFQAFFEIKLSGKTSYKDLLNKQKKAKMKLFE